MEKMFVPKIGGEGKFDDMADSEQKNVEEDNAMVTWS